MTTDAPSPDQPAPDPSPPQPAPQPAPPPQPAPTPARDEDGLLGRIGDMLAKRDDALVGRLEAALKPPDPPKIEAPEPAPEPTPESTPEPKAKGGKLSSWYHR